MLGGPGERSHNDVRAGPQWSQGRLSVAVGYAPENVNEEIRERNVRYLERMRNKKEKEEKKVGKAKGKTTRKAGDQ